IFPGLKSINLYLQLDNTISLHSGAGPPQFFGNVVLRIANNRPKPEEIIKRLRQVDVLMGQDMVRLAAIRKIRVGEQTYYYCWHKQYGEMSATKTFSEKGKRSKKRTIQYRRLQHQRQAA
ncbi:MAG: hypothetical protein L7U61_06410, partial [Flavobacteriaceae bacterium]|nr:hypothetical protein [Flavobacteriaceae bacterium]